MKYNPYFKIRSDSSTPLKGVSPRSHVGEGSAAEAAARRAGTSRARRLLGSRGSSHQRHTGLPHQHTGGMGRPPGNMGPGIGQKRPNSRKHLLGFLFLPIAGEEGCFWKPAQRPTTVDELLLSTRLLLAHSSAVFCGEQRETQGTKQTVSPTSYNNHSNQVLGEYCVLGAELGGWLGPFCFLFLNIVARNST